MIYVCIEVILNGVTQLFLTYLTYVYQNLVLDNIYHLHVLIIIHDVDVEWIGYHSNVHEVVGQKVVACTPSEDHYGYMDWYNKLSHPRLVPTLHDA